MMIGYSSLGCVFNRIMLSFFKEETKKLVPFYLLCENA